MYLVPNLLKGLSCLSILRWVLIFVQVKEVRIVVVISGKGIKSICYVSLLLNSLKSVLHFLNIFRCQKGIRIPTMRSGGNWTPRPSSTTSTHWNGLYILSDSVSFLWTLGWVKRFKTEYKSQRCLINLLWSRVGMVSVKSTVPCIWHSFTYFLFKTREVKDVVIYLLLRVVVVTTV